MKEAKVYQPLGSAWPVEDILGWAMRWRLDGEEPLSPVKVRASGEVGDCLLFFSEKPQIWWNKPELQLSYLFEGRWVPVVRDSSVKDGADIYGHGDRVIRWRTEP